MIYTVPFHGIALPAFSGSPVFKTVAGIIVPNGARCAVVRACVGPADATPQDRDLVAKILRATTLGTVTTVIAVGDIPRSDPAGRNPLCTASITYTGEPTYDTYGTFALGMNDRGGIDHPFMSEDQEPKVIGGGTVMIGLLVGAMSGTTPLSVVSGYIAFREY